MRQTKDEEIKSLKQQLTGAESRIAALEAQLGRDHLTGLNNAQGFREFLDLAGKRAARNGGSVAVIYIDLDGFKPINDQHGHAAGDEVLKRVANRIMTRIRKTDAAARLGGDEFAVAIEGVCVAHVAEKIAHQILDIIGKPIMLNDKILTIGASIGIAADSGQDAEVLKNKADLAMYKAKRNGKRRVVIHSDNVGVAGYLVGR